MNRLRSLEFMRNVTPLELVRIGHFICRCRVGSEGLRRRSSINLPMRNPKFLRLLWRWTILILNASPFQNSYQIKFEQHKRPTLHQSYCERSGYCLKEITMNKSTTAEVSWEYNVNFFVTGFVQSSWYSWGVLQSDAIILDRIVLLMNEPYLCLCYHVQLFVPRCFIGKLGYSTVSHCPEIFQKMIWIG